MAKNFWDKYQKPWTKEQCERRYVQGGDGIGLRPLAEVSGQPVGTLKRWSTQCFWPDKRNQYATKLNTVVQEKTIEKISEKVSENLSDLAVEHFEANKMFRDLAQEIVGAELKKIAVAKTKDEEAYQKAIEEAKWSVKAMSLWSQIMTRSLQGEAAVTGLNFEVDLDAAANVLRRRGYEINDPQQSEDDMPSLIVELTDAPITPNSNEVK